MAIDAHPYDFIPKSFKNAKRIFTSLNESVKCPRCDKIMVSMQACHMICTNCGAHLDCSDKGSFW